MIPYISGEGSSRSVTVNVVNRLEIKPPEIFVERTHILSGEELVIKWKPSKYFRAIRVTISRDASFTDIANTIVAEEPTGTKLGKFATGQWYVRASWEPSSVQNVKG